jgi:hypothetical protein|tara:strand:+ start:5510 stop:5848 length:339 start_codon:yes stop_codon:yes gene_type:complete
MATPQWHEEARTWQPYSKHKAFTHTTTGNTAEEVFTVAGNAEYFQKISFICETNDLYIEFDGDAVQSTTAGSLLVPAGEGYSDTNIYIGTSLSVIVATNGSNGRIRGIAWGR